MVSKYGDWLNEIEVCVLPTCAATRSHEAQRPAAEPSTSTQQHQLRKDFEDCCKRSKRRRLVELSKVDSSAIAIHGTTCPLLNKRSSFMGWK